MIISPSCEVDVSNGVEDGDLVAVFEYLLVPNGTRENIAYRSAFDLLCSHIRQVRSQIGLYRAALQNEGKLAQRIDCRLDDLSVSKGVNGICIYFAALDAGGLTIRLIDENESPIIGVILASMKAKPVFVPVGDAVQKFTLLTEPHVFWGTDESVLPKDVNGGFTGRSFVAHDRVGAYFEIVNRYQAESSGVVIQNHAKCEMPPTLWFCRFLKKRDRIRDSVD